MIKRSRDILLNIKGDIKSPFFKWKYGNMEVWKYGSMEIWKYGSMEVLPFIHVFCNVVAVLSS
jgi:hypothetical protein